MSPETITKETAATGNVASDIAAKSKPLNQPPLPSPADRPDADIVLFDGQCKFCWAQVARLNRWDWRGQLAFLSLHDQTVKERWPNLTHDQLMKEMYVVTNSDKAHPNTYHRGADAFRYLSRHIPSMWLAAPFLHIPFSLPFWDWAYQQVANRRYKLMGKLDPCDGGTCSLHFGDGKK